MRVVRVSARGAMRLFVEHAVAGLREDGSVEVCGEGDAAGKAVSVVEIVKRRVPGTHQVTRLDGAGDGQPALRVTLSADPPAGAPALPGYQPPLPADLVAPEPVPARRPA